jgi:NADH-quinone oxidoreductase subunit L
MLLTLLFVVLVYLFAVESFTAFLYPNPAEVALYFQAAALPNWLFDLLLLGATLSTILGWLYLYLRAHGRSVWMPPWVDGVRIRLFVLFMNRLYVEQAYQQAGKFLLRLLHRIDKHAQGWSQR